MGKYFQMLADVSPACPPQAGVGGKENEADKGEGGLRTLAKPLRLEKKKFRPREVE